jgi:hypothetical protein
LTDPTTAAHPLQLLVNKRFRQVEKFEKRINGPQDLVHKFRQLISNLIAPDGQRSSMEILLGNVTFVNPSSALQYL